MSQNSLRKAKEATENQELLGSTNQDDADRQVEDINRTLENSDPETVERREQENAEQVKARSRKQNKKANK